MAAERHPRMAGLDQACAVCRRPAGDHTLREWSACLGQQTTDLPFEPVPDDIAAAASENLRASFGIDSDIVIADHIVARAITLDGASGPVRVRLPALLHEFQVGVAGQPPTTVAKVLFAGNFDSIRGYGRLIRDTANGAANAAAKGA